MSISHSDSVPYGYSPIYFVSRDGSHGRNKTYQRVQHPDGA